MQKAQPLSCEARILISSRISGSMPDLLSAWLMAAMPVANSGDNFLEGFPVDARVGSFGGGHRTFRTSRLRNAMVE